jgi:hypothetical protein
MEQNENEYVHDFEDRSVELSNFDPGNTTEEDVFEMCRTCGEIESIDMTQKAAGRIGVLFFDLRSAYALVRTTIRVRGFKWLIQFGRYESIYDPQNPPNTRAVVLFRIPGRITTEMIRYKFSEFGEIREIREWTSNRFVEFWDSRSTIKAIAGTHKKKVFGCKIAAELCRPGGARLNTRAYNDNKLPTIARVNRKAKRAITLEITKLDYPPETPHLKGTRTEKTFKAPLVVTITQNRRSVSA